jgi:hypothetical protein
MITGRKELAKAMAITLLFAGFLVAVKIISTAF